MIALKILTTGLLVFMVISLIVNYIHETKLTLMESFTYWGMMLVLVMAIVCMWF
jgi:hypothetical protein